jgi:hypothetical protein
MGKARTSKKRPGNKKSSRHQNRLQHRQAIDHAVILIDTVCLIAGSEDLIGDHSDEPTQRLRAAIASHNTTMLFGWLMEEALSFQGISNRVALG